MSISSCRLLRLIDYIRSFFCCAVQVIPAMMWGGTSSIGSGEAKLKYFYGDLSSKPLDISSVLCQGRRLWVVLVELQSEVSSWRQLERV
ncbi:unnamed protein product [Brassica rapa]|uniref:Uncharacterized protein n=2 Tax=Brassica TaxID=3705 RepID=A0A3P6BC29_BRACM|nr:unnamed protein product [Brassica napus]CAG7902159.1 unnamed protein product [Brassica rapa]VDC98093.1 unnamed protein product [Brassica rapa]